MLIKVPRLTNGKVTIGYVNTDYILAVVPIDENTSRVSLAVATFTMEVGAAASEVARAINSKADLPVEIPVEAPAEIPPPPVTAQEAPAVPRVKKKK